MRFFQRLCLMFVCFFVGINAPAGEALKIGLICSGSVTDGGWNQIAHDAIVQARRDLGVAVSVLQKVKPDNCGNELRAYAADGYGLVIAHGYEFLTPAAEVAASGTHMRIVVCGADVAKPGIMTLDFDVSQASFQLGIIAGRLSKTGKLGFVGGSPIPSVKACYRGFAAGARSVRADISVVEAYTSWDEPVKSKTQSEAFFAQGIDLVYHDVDAASRGVFEAVKERNAKMPNSPVYVFGCVADQNANPICANFTLASAVIRLDKTFRTVVEAVQAQTFAPGVVRENLARGTCVAVLNPLLRGTLLSDALVREVEAAGVALVNGSIAIPSE